MNNSEISDKTLISEYLSGKHQSLEILIQRYKRRIFSYICVHVKDQELADDIFQDTFIKVIKSLKTGTYNEEGKFLPWVMRISHNLIIDYFRQVKRAPVFEKGTDDYNVFSRIKIYDESQEEKIVTQQIHEDVKKIIEVLPPEQKEVLFMRYYADMSFKQIAEELDISINTALGRMRYAIINLRKYIKEKDIVLTY